LIFSVAALNVRDLGDFIRDQRRAAQISLRELAKQAGVSNPYLSQIERGLRKPSAEILQQIAKGLRISAEALYVQAGILEEREGNADLLSAVLTDTELSERQKQVILDIYEAFRRENSGEPPAEAAAPPPPAPPPAPAPAPKPAAAPKPKPTTARTTRTTKAAPKAAPKAPPKATTATDEPTSP
jgi:transcriptional regulator with XRE-family HTH domain